MSPQCEEFLEMLKAAAFALLILLGTPLPGSACSCLDVDSPCQAYQSSDVVVAGVVTDIRDDAVDITIDGVKAGSATRRWIRLRVEEPLKGGAREMTMVTGGGGGDCGYPFSVGGRYLVYASVTEPMSVHLNPNQSPTPPPPPAGVAPGPLYGVTSCGRTRMLADAEDDLALVRALVRGRPETRIFGQVDRLVRPLGTYEYAIEPAGPMADVVVEARGRDQTLRTRTDDRGTYRFLNPPPGRYQVTVHPPSGFAMFPDGMDATVDVDVKTAACSAEHDVSLEIDGRISGRVIDARGQPVAGGIQVSIVTISSADKGLEDVHSRSEYTQDGRYEFTGLPPGDYLLGVSIAAPPQRRTPYEATYYPGVSDRGRARVFRLSAGEQLTGIDISLPERMSEVIITGIIKRADGTSVGTARVELYDARMPSLPLPLGPSANTDVQKRFSVPAFRGREYLLRASAIRPGDASPTVSPAVAVRAVDGMPPVELVIGAAADAGAK
jgi:hypothetical protein